MAEQSKRKEKENLDYLGLEENSDADEQRK